MSFVFRLADVGEGIHEAEIVEILVEVGDEVKEDQEVFKVETDKAVVGLPAPVSGTVAEIPNIVGDVVKVGEPLMVFQTTDDASIKEPAIVDVDPQEAEEYAPIKKPTPPRRPLATPHTRHLARKLGVDINAIQGSGKNGRITDEDVENAAKAVPVVDKVDTSVLKTPSVEAENPEPANGKFEPGEYGPTRRIAFKGIRKRTAEAMTHSFFTIPHVWHTEDVDVTDLFQVVKAQRDDAQARGIKLTPLAFITRAVTSALKTFPQVNSSLDEDANEIVLKDYVNIGFAVETEHGLMVPVVRHADKKSILQLATDIQTLSDRARSREIELAELRGGTFTITNVGVVGGAHATPIIHSPQVGILAIMQARQKPVALNDEIVIRRIMPLVLAYDHRVLDGAIMARFMNHIKHLLEDPMRMLVELV